jgi:hypothetical protein
MLWRKFSPTTRRLSSERTLAQSSASAWELSVWWWWSPALCSSAVGGLRALCTFDGERRHKRAEASRGHMRSEQPDPPHVEVSRPDDVLVAPAVEDPAETRARTRRQRERANNARLKTGHPEAREVRLAIPREHPQFRIQPHTMTARPTAARRLTGSYTDELANTRMLLGQHPLAAGD